MISQKDAEDSNECEKEDYASVCMVKEAQFDSEFEDCEEECDEPFFECIEHFESPLKSSTIWLADGFPGDNFQQVMMVKEVPFYDNVTMTLDSGADVSVAPPEYYHLGEPGLSRAVHMIDAQGERTRTPGNRRLRLVAKTKHGEEIEFVENFALGEGVSHPLLSMGKLFRSGGTVQNDGPGLFLTNSEKAVQIPARLERNSLVMDVRVCAIRAEAVDPKPDSDVEVVEESGSAACEKGRAACEKGWTGMKVKEEAIVLDGEFDCIKEARIRILKGYLSRELAMLESIPGWHVPNGIVVHFNPTATHLLDATANFGPEWTSRMTLVKIEDSGGQWEQLESEESYRDIESPFRPLSKDGKSKKTLTFVAPARIKDYFVENSEVPISQYPLLDGEVASWPDDDEDEVEGGEIPVLAAEGGAPAEMREDDPRP